MAAPSRTVPHPGRALLLLLVLIVAMLLGILGPKLFAPSQWEHRFKVGLGLDLSSGTQVTLQAQTLSGKAPSADEMNAAVGVIEGRVNGTGNSGAQVQPQGTDLIIVTVPGKGSQQTIQLVSSTALLMFRQVLLYEPYSATSTTTPAATPSTSASAVGERVAVGLRDLLGEGNPVRQFHQYREDLGQDRPGRQRQLVAQRHRLCQRLGQRQPLGQLKCEPERQPELVREQHHVR